MNPPWLGIRNPGSLCFASACFQLLYSVEPFRQLVLESPSCPISGLPALFTSLSQIKGNGSDELFSELPDLTELSKDLKLELRIDLQRDASEFLRCVISSLLSAVESKWPGCIHDIFGGEINNIIYPENSLGLKSNCSISRNEKIFFLSLDVVGYSDLSDSLRSYISRKNLNFSWPLNDNGIKEMRPSFKKTSILKAPQFLIIMLKRFEFDFTTRRVKKRNDEFKFPIVLEFSQYMNSESVCDNSIPLIDNSAERYSLGGVVVHNGSASTGHYYSLCKNRSDSKWYLFDDQSVADFNLEEDIEAEAFGCSDGSSTGRNAFILVYDKLS